MSEFFKELSDALLSTHTAEYFNKVNTLSETGKQIYYGLLRDFESYGFKDGSIGNDNVLDFALKIDEVIENNTYAGWPLTKNMDVISYAKINMETENKKERDDLFVEMFEKDNFKLLKNEKDTLIKKTDSKYSKLMVECFTAFDRGLLCITIPCLITMIEGLAAITLDTKKYGSDLWKEWVKKIGEEDIGPDYLISISVIKLVRKLFKFHEFNKNRQEILNRNWVLHGRDDPRLWSKKDFYSLISILSSMQSLKEY